MPFRWFKRHEKTLMYGIAFVIMPTFLIGAGAFVFFGSLGRSGVSVKYDLVPGQTTSVSDRRMQDLARRYRVQNPNVLAERAALLDEAELAGIYVSDAEVKDFIQQMLQQVFPTGYTMDQYSDWVARVAAPGRSVRQFEKNVREQLTVQRLASIKGLKRHVATRQVYDSYAREHTRLELEYVKVTAEDMKSDIDIFDFDPKEVQEFYDRVKENPEQYAWALANYQVPERFDVEALFLQFEDADPEVQAWIFETDTPPTDDEMRSYYDRRIAWFTPESEAGASEDDEEAPVPVPTPFEDVKDDIRKRLLIERAFETIHDELLGQQEAGGLPDFEEFAAEKTVLFQRLVEKDITELEADSIIGYEGMSFPISEVATGELGRGVITSNPDGVYVFRVVKKHEPDFKPQAVVDIELRNDLRTEKARQAMQDRIEEIYGQMETWAGEQIDKENGETDDADEDEEPAEEKDPNEMTDEERVAKATRDAAIRDRLGDAFLAVAEEQGLEVGKIGPRRFLRRGTDEYTEEEDLTTKFLLAHASVSILDEGAVQRRLLDTENWAGYIVKMIGKKNPDASEMTEEDIETYETTALFRSYQIYTQGRAQFEATQFLKDINLRGRDLQQTGGVPGAPAGG